MITREKFDFIKEKYGHYSSWAIWAYENPEKPKSNLGDLTVLDPDKNKDLLSKLNPNVVLVALNFSRGAVKYPLGNFHEYHPHGTDYKTRYALRDTAWWGGYMTDILKDFDEKESGKVSAFLRKNKQFEQKNVETFREELIDLGSKNQIIIAFGKQVYDILERNFPEFKIIKIPHYAHRINKEKYREQVSTIWRKTTKKSENS